ncbi:MAG: hypothetical protein M1479_08940 [Actinobacteria bacterium]|nr:hypothetical protein [Actinomycetota bacterium]MCL5772382.1 hypothetical protein [Actinomycetota bacterium]
MPQIIDAIIDEKEFNYILANCENIKSMGLKNNVGSRIIIDNDFIDKYLYGENK